MKQVANQVYSANILVVDDTPANLHLLVRILNRKEYKVQPITSGELAIATAQEILPDLILLDIMMPEMNGYEVCKKLKIDERTKNIPVIFISAMSEVQDKVKAFRVGGVDYITKPFQVEEVLARVETHLTIGFLQKNLAHKNEELSKTLEELTTTQKQLIHSEKMAALGQLIAGIAHEINTPLGAIRSSIENIEIFFNENLKKIPDFFQKISPENQQYFWSLLQFSTTQNYCFSSREKRQLKKILIQKLEKHSLDKIEMIADTLVDIGINNDNELEKFLPLLQDLDGENILKVAYQFASVKKSSKTIATATGRVAKIVFALKNYARYESIGEKVEANVIEGIEMVLTLYYHQFKRGIEVIKDYEELPLIWCYPDELNQVWTNLIHNSIQAMNNQGILSITATHKDGLIQISIIDNGTGISPENRKKIFQPFFTTKPRGEGTGLGLSIVKKIIEKHQGKIEVDSLPGKTRFTVFLPIQFSDTR
jgi:signal transduction histidine kinase